MTQGDGSASDGANKLRLHLENVEAGAVITGDSSDLNFKP